MPSLDYFCQRLLPYFVTSMLQQLCGPVPICRALALALYFWSFCRCLPPSFRPVGGTGIAFEVILQLGVFIQMRFHLLDHSKNMRLEFESEPNAIGTVTVAEPLSHSPNDENASAGDLLKEGISCAQKGRREDARLLLTRAVEACPQNVDAWMWLASISEYPEELLAYLDKALSIDPANRRAIEWQAATRSLLAKTFVQRGIDANNDGSVELAASFCDQALDHDDRSVVAWLWKARLASSDDEKVRFLETVLGLDPTNHEALNAIAPYREPSPQQHLEEAKWAAVAGKRKQALHLLDLVLEKAPDNSEAWVLRSHLSISLKDKLYALEKALEVDPGDAAARAGYDFLKSTVLDVRNENEPHAVESVPVSRAPETSDADLIDPKEQPSEPACEMPSAEVVSQPTVETIAPAVVDDLAETDQEHVEPVELTGPPDDLGVENLDEPVQLELESQPTQNGHVMGVEDAHDAGKGLEPENGCSFCDAPVDAQAFECSNCRAVLTLSDIESLLANPHANRIAIQQAVTEMEAEWNLREFSVEELTVLGIGHFNMRSFEQGFKYLQEASRLDPNNVILAGQVNALAIRLEEVRRQDEIDESKPKGKSILVVDDSPTVRKLIAAKLEKSGHNVICAADGIEGLEKLEERVPDLVLLDIAMPRMDGYEVCKQIRSNSAAASVPVVMISGKDGFFDKVRGKMAGCTGYVTKPFGPETLMRALDIYLLPKTGGAE